MIGAILLAAGRSRRMGVQKLLLPLGDRTVIAHIAGEVRRSPVGMTVAVVGRDAATVAAALGRCGTPAAASSSSRQGCDPFAPEGGGATIAGGGAASGAASHPLIFVTNPDPEGDMLSSVRCGLRRLPPDCEAVLVVLGDQPSTSSDLIGRMVEVFRAEGRGIVVPVHDRRRGHPLLFAGRYRDEVLTRYDDVGLRGLLRAHPEDVFELTVASPAVLEDMDVPEDYRREQARFRQ